MCTVLKHSRFDGIGYYTCETTLEEWERQIPLYESEYKGADGVYHRDVTYTFNPPRAWQPVGIDY